MSELQAAMGLSVLPYMEEIILKRQRICLFYDSHLDFGFTKKLKIRAKINWNYASYPIICSSKEVLMKILKELNNRDIFPRRYFYPSLEGLPYVNSEKCPIAAGVANRVLCLPLYTSLEIDDLKNIVTIINNG
jgi:dTDP-4-amino-4,6-dideoxygalactose transaminase